MTVCMCVVNEQESPRIANANEMCDTSYMSGRRHPVVSRLPLYLSGSDTGGEGLSAGASSSTASIIHARTRPDMAQPARIG